MRTPIKLYDLAGDEDTRCFSPYCWRVKMALAHKGLEVESIPWRFTEKEALSFSGQGRVPVIVDQGRAIFDSWTIAQYLDEAYPDRPRLFEGEESHTLTYFFKHWCESLIHAAILRAVVLDLYGHLHEKDKAYFRESREKRFGMSLEQYGANPQAAIADLRAGLFPARSVLAEQFFLSGRGPGFADYILFGAFQWARTISPKPLLEPDDPVYAWRERVLDLHDGYARHASGYPVRA
jgi:glutathione S-transferase